MKSYVLHYAPDNASLVVRLALEELGVDYVTRLVDRSQNAQRGAAYRALNPVGRIPALETPQGPMFETAAILLWLGDTHRDRIRLTPDPHAPQRAQFLSWLFFISNTIHAELRSLFYPETIVGDDPAHQAMLRAKTRENLTRHYSVLNTEYTRGKVLGSTMLSICDLYVMGTLRWPAIYPATEDRSWFDLERWPALAQRADFVQSRDSVAALIKAEGLSAQPFTRPELPQPPEGSAI